MMEYTDKDMVKSLVKTIESLTRQNEELKSLVKTIESLTRQNEELRKEIEALRAKPVMRFDSASLGLSPVTDGEW